MLVFAVAAAVALPAPPPTRFTAPLAADGLVDVAAALNARLAAGVTPDRNCNALLWRAIGPTPERHAVPAEFFRRLGVPPPAADGPVFRRLSDHLRDAEKLDPDRLAAVIAQQDDTVRRPWTPRDHPEFARWLAANAAALAVVREAAARPAYFNPVVPRLDEANRPGLLLGAPQPGVQACREFAAALSGRAMLRLGEGKPDAAWADIVAGFRLARHVAADGMLIEYLVGLAIDGVMTAAALRHLEHANLSADQLARRRADLAALPPFPSTTRHLDLATRAAFHDAFNSVRREWREAAARRGSRPPDGTKAQARADRAFDRLAAATRIPDRRARAAALAALEAEFRRQRRDLVETTVAAGAFSLLIGGSVGPAVARFTGDMTFGLLLPAVEKVQAARDRNEQAARNLDTALALARYRRDRGRYPARLADLAPAYLPAEPVDLFTGRPPVYRPAGAGYLLYSVGPNGRDDGGRPTWADAPGGDDVPVRVPAGKE